MSLYFLKSQSKVLLDFHTLIVFLGIVLFVSPEIILKYYLQIKHFKIRNILLITLRFLGIVVFYSGFNYMFFINQ